MSATGRPPLGAGLLAAAGLLAPVLAADPAAAAAHLTVPPPSKAGPSPVADRAIVGYLLLDQLEYRANEGADTFNWEAEGWLGGDYNKLWLKSEGEQEVSGGDGGEAEGQVLYARLIAPFWYAQAGLRYDRLWGGVADPSRAFGVLGVEGLAPYLFDVQPALFVSQDGDLSARLEAETDLLLTQRLILQPRVEVEAAAQQVEKFGVGSGLNDVELGLRLRYEIVRKLAPYVGVNWTRLFGDTRDFAREEGDQASDVAFLAGVRLWW